MVTARLDEIMSGNHVREALERETVSRSNSASRGAASSHAERLPVMRIKPFPMILLVVSLVLAGAAGVYASTFIEAFRAGTEAEDSGNMDEAVRQFSEAIKLHPTSARAWAKRGELYLKKGDPQSAIKDLAQAIKIDPAYAPAFIRLGFAYNAINDYDRAVEPLSIAILLDSSSSEAFNTRGFAYNGKNDYESAIKDFDRAIRLNPNDARYYNNRGFAYNGKHEYDKAIEDFDKAIKINANSDMFYNNRGVAYLRKREFDKALEDLDKAIKINSQSYSAYHNRGMAYSGKGRHEKAVEEFSKVLEINPSSTLLLKDRATAYRKLGEYELALADLRKSLELDKKFAPGYAALGLLHALAPAPPIRNPAQALKAARKALELSGGNSPDMYENLAEVQYAIQDTAGAITSLKRALSMDPRNNEYLDLLKKWEGSTLPATPLPVAGEAKGSPFPTLW
jgi:tetratricopeptide (TPR) repeat protein